MPIIEWTEVVDASRPRGREFAGWTGIDQAGREYRIAGHTDGSGLWQITLPDGTQSPGILGGGSVRQSAEEWASDAGSRELPDRTRIPLDGITATDERQVSPRASRGRDEAADLLSEIARLVEHRARIDSEIALGVARARREPFNASWAEIGAHLGVSGQAAGQKYGGKR